MHMLPTSNPHRAVAWLAASIRQLREQRQARLAERQANLRLANELAAASDRHLAELGFSRADISEIARGTYQR